MVDVVGRWRVLAVVGFLALGSAGCGSSTSDGRARATTSDGRPAVPSRHAPVENLRTYRGAAVAVAAAGGVVLAADRGYPANVRAYDPENPGAPARIVNPPMDLYFVGIVASGDGFLVAGQDCTGATRPGPDDEPACPGRPVVLRYDPAEDAWTVVSSDAGDPSAGRVWRVASFPGPDGGMVVASFGDRRTLRLVEGDGSVRPVPLPPFEGVEAEDLDVSVRLCPVDGGLVAYRGSGSDVLDPSTSIASRYAFDAERWSEPVALSSAGALPPPVTTVHRCTDQGLALLGVGDRDAAALPSASTDGTRWVISDGPGIDSVRVPVDLEAALFDGILWSHDADGRWVAGPDLGADVVAATRLDDGHLAALVAAGDERAPARLEVVADPQG